MTFITGMHRPEAHRQSLFQKMRQKHPLQFPPQISTAQDHCPLRREGYHRHARVSQVNRFWPLVPGSWQELKREVNVAAQDAHLSFDGTCFASHKLCGLTGDSAGYDPQGSNSSFDSGGHRPTFSKGAEIS